MIEKFERNKVETSEQEEHMLVLDASSSGDLTLTKNIKGGIT
jgi:hypothetical protein